MSSLICCRRREVSHTPLGAFLVLIADDVGAEPEPHLGIELVRRLRRGTSRFRRRSTSPACVLPERTPLFARKKPALVRFVVSALAGYLRQLPERSIGRAALGDSQALLAAHAVGEPEAESCEERADNELCNAQPVHLTWPASDTVTIPSPQVASQPGPTERVLRG